MTTCISLCNKKNLDLRLDYLIWQEETDAHHIFHSSRNRMLFLSFAI